MTGRYSLGKPDLVRLTSQNSSITSSTTTSRSDRCLWFTILCFVLWVVHGQAGGAFTAPPPATFVTRTSSLAGGAAALPLE
jgi:hypothetical protein